MKRLLWTMPVALMLAMPGCGSPPPPPKKAPPKEDHKDHDHGKGGDHDHDEKGAEKPKVEEKSVDAPKVDDAPPVKDPLEKIEK